jgi:hypothetical protein
MSLPVVGNGIQQQQHARHTATPDLQQLILVSSLLSMPHALSSSYSLI